ncbi:MAG: transposase [Blastochloris sp.]|nr:transposase [Blastochloris sp.]
MANFVSCDRDQAFLLPPDLKEWLPDDDLAHFVIAAAERTPLAAFKINDRNSGSAQYHPHMMLALLIYCYANGTFSSRRIERATYRDVGVRFVAANSHPDHHTIALFRKTNKAAMEAALLQVLLLAKEAGLLRVGTVAIDGTKLDANASKIRSLRYDRAKALREKLKSDIADLMAKAEAADAEGEDPQALPAEIARREALHAKLDAACARLEEEARAEAAAAQPAYEEKRAKYEANNRKGRKPEPPDDEPPPARQTNLTDPDSALMRKSNQHEYRQAYNAQAVVDAEGPQLILAVNVGRTPTDQPTFAATVLAMQNTVGLPQTVLADAGFASGPAIQRLKDHGVEPLVAIARTEPQRAYDFRPPPDPKPQRRVSEPWRLAMQAKLETDDAKSKYRLRKQSVEPVFGIVKSAMGFTRFLLRGLDNVKTEWTLVALAYNCRRLTRLRTA